MAGARSVTFAVDVDAPILQARHPVIGDALAAVTDTGSEPVKIGGVYRTAPATLVAGQRGEALLTQKGQLAVTFQDQANLQYAGVLNGGSDAIVGSANSGILVLAYNLVATGALNWDRQRTPSKFVPLAATAITAGTGATIWTPAGGKKFRLMGWLLSYSVAAQMIFGDNAIGTVIARSELVAAAGVSKAGAADLGNGLLSAVANNVLKLDATVTGSVSGMVWGTEE